MAVFAFTYSLVYQLVLILVIIHGAVSYEKILLEESKLCKLRPDDRNPSIMLGKEKGSSKIVTQKNYFAEWTGRYRFECSFSVRAPEDYGIYAVIQVLNFRKNLTSRMCKDYVHFSVPENFLTRWLKEKRHEKRICGRIYAAQTYVTHSNPPVSRYAIDTVAENGFVAHDGRMFVTIYIASERLKKDEKLEVKIAFTAFKNDCNKRSKHIECKMCELIWEGLVGDNVQNCPYTSCLDENHCKDLESPFEIHDVVSNETGTKVTVVAISAIMITFFIFTLCLCACRRNQKCCWRAPHNNGVRVEMNRTARTNADNDFVARVHALPSDVIAPSAPAMSDLKDVPPSYESLFPSKQI